MTDLSLQRPFTVLGQGACKEEKKGSQRDITPVEGNIYALRYTIVQKLVAPQVTLQPANIDRIRIIKTVQLRQLDIESYFIALVLSWISIHGFAYHLARLGRSTPRRV